MVSELGGGQPSPAASLADAQQEAPHPVAAVSSVHAPSGPKAAAKQQQGTCDAMVVDAEMAGQDPLVLRSLSPASSSDLTVPALDPSPGLVSGFVSVSEVGGAAANATPSASLQPQQRQQLSACGPGSSGEDEEEPCSGGQGLARPVSATGYESGDDMDVLNMQHCTNCTGTLWGHICRDCGHMPAHDLDIFHPTVASASALHRPRLQGDALTVLCWDERMELHEEAGSSMHPERPDRVRAVMARLQAAELAGRCTRLPAREATPAEVQACHIPELMEAVDMLSEQARLQGNAGLHFSPDTYVNQHTAMCAKLSAGACVDVAAAVVRGEARAGVAVVRPPGHHAESNTAMGFCFYNNAGIAARAAQAAGADRVLVLDWDVHHGNGTQHIFESDPSVLYMSLHRHDGGAFYPGTGAAHEVGQGLGEGYSVNLPWPCGGMRNGDYLAAFQHVVLPIAYEYCPDLVIISAGFDAAEGDPIGGCHLTPECYAHMAAQLQLVAPTVALLEGGYNLLSTARGTEAVVRVLLGERPPQLPPAQQQPCEYSMAAVAQVMRIQARYWGCMRALGQQQLKLLAATAARQEHLAAMKLRRQQAAAADMAAAQAELGLPLGLGADGLEDGLEGEAEEEVGGHMHGSRARPHFRLGRMEGMEEVEADTPHREYRGGSGWESDADLGSDEQPLSRETSDCGSGGARERRQTDGGGGYGPRSFFASPLSASPLRLAPAEHLASDTDPISDSEAEGEPQQQQQNHWQQYHQQCAGEALASGSLAPSPGSEAAGTVTPAVERLGASASPLTEEAAPLLVQQGCEEQERQPGGTPGGSRGGGGGAALESPPLSEGAVAAAAAAARWKSLAVPPIVLKRPGQALHQRAVHQRLDPSLAEEALELLGSMSGPLQQQQEQPSEERAVPQQEQQA